MSIPKCSSQRFAWNESVSDTRDGHARRLHGQTNQRGERRVLATDARFGLTFSDTLIDGESLAQYLTKRQRELRRDDRNGSLIGANFEDLPWIDEYSLNTTLGPHGFCASLLALNLNSCGLGVTDTLLRGIAKRCNGLRSLSIRDAPQVSEQGFLDFSQTCCTLTKLNMAENPQLFPLRPTERNLGTKQSLLTCLIASNTGLTHLDLSFCGHNIKVGDLFNELEAVGARKADTSLSHEVDGFTRSKICDAIDSSMTTTQFCPQTIPDYEYDITEMNEVHIQTSSAPLAEVGIKVGQLRLEHLDLSGCTNVNDAAVSAIGARCPRLRYLSLSLAHAITSLGLLVISEGCPSLQYLDLTGIKQLDRTGVTMVVSRCDQLETLLMSGCIMLNGSLLETIARSTECRKVLRVIDISGWQDVSPQAIQNLIRACPRLERLSAELVSALDHETEKLIVTIKPHMMVVRRKGSRSDPHMTGLVPGFKQPPAGRTFAGLFPYGGVVKPKKKKGGGKKKKK